MCGFAGEWLLTDGQADREVARCMASRLVHRGPDEEGAYLSPDGRLALGFRRLRVIDPAGSHQPMSLPDGSVTVAFNGEIYNFRTLRDELRADGASFRTAGDTEVLLHMYVRFGADMLRRLEGMFALVLYDRAAGRVLLARDRLGQKPLWYAALPGRVVFASEAKALLAHPNVGRHVALSSLAFYAAHGYIPAPLTGWRDVSKLLPGNYLSLDFAPTEPVAYWRPQAVEAPAGREEARQAVREAVDASVRARMVADVPLGALLSGGIDSSILVALMARAAGDTGGVRTFTAGFEDTAYDERPAAAEVARHCGTDHTELLVRPDPAGALDRIVELYDEPFADSSALPTFLVCQAAREHVTVALAGDGGDEVFGGYDRYRAMHLAERMSPGLYFAVRIAAALARPFAPVHERNRLRRFLRFADGIPHPPALQYLKYRSLFAPQDLSRLFTEDFATEHDLAAPQDWFCNLYEEAELPDEAACAQYHDLSTYLPDDLLVKSDIASMASSLELRSPMLDHRLVALGLSLPIEWKIRGRYGKAILREAFADLLPPTVFERPKRGFGVPLARWLREDLREEMIETLTDRGLTERGIIRPEAIAGLLNDHLNGVDDHSHRLWALLVLARWLDRNA